MLAARQFRLEATLRQPEIQPGCPVYVHCTRRSVEPNTGASFLQIRMVNCAQQQVQTVVFSIEGLDASGNRLFLMEHLILSDCGAPPHSVFGEKKIFALISSSACRERITVERVGFADGILWRRAETEGLVSEAEAGYVSCPCGMRSPKGMAACLLCGASLIAPLPPPAEVCPEIPPPDLPLPPQPLALPLRPSPSPGEAACQPAPPAEPTEEPEASSWLVVLLCVLGVIALLLSISFLTYCLMQYLGKI